MFLLMKIKLRSLRENAPVASLSEGEESIYPRASIKTKKQSLTAQIYLHLEILTSKIHFHSFRK